MEEENSQYREVEFYGVLITHSNVTWYVLMNKPVDREEWMNDHERMWLVCQPYGKPERIIVSGYTLRADARGRVPVMRSQEEEVELLKEDYKDLFVSHARN